MPKDVPRDQEGRDISLVCLVEHIAGNLATCEDGGGDLAQEIADFAKEIREHPHYQLLEAVLVAADVNINRRASVRSTFDEFADKAVGAARDVGMSMHPPDPYDD